MLAISQGAEKKALDQIKAMGIDNILVHSKQPSREGTQETDASNRSMVQAYGLSRLDLQNISKMDNVKYVDVVRNSRKKVLRGLTRLDVKLVSCSLNLDKAMNLNLVRGRWFSTSDEMSRNPVCVIGRNARKKIFGLGEQVIVGNTIKVEDQVFRIIGIVENNKGANLQEIGDMNDLIYIPHQLSEGIYGKQARDETGSRSATTYEIEYDLFIIKVKEIEAIGNTEKRISNYMSQTHAKTKDWGMVVPLALLTQQAETQKIFTVVMASIASISLVVGGVGIMNIMLANIYERRREIGTSRALGAKQMDILRQFLVETVFLTTVGGICGVLMGIGISELITRYAKWPTEFTSWSILLSLLIS
ncbi:MAG: ABC transporter permease, partial [Lentisphaeria bacterium]